MTWKVGDFGRFASENPKYPRFEVLPRLIDTPDKITVWYSGSKKPTKIPRETFFSDCVNWWSVEITKDKPPDWLDPQSRFSLEGPQRSILITVTQITQNYNVTDHSVDVKGLPLVYRRRRMDYISCTTVEDNCLFLIPLKKVIEFGRPIKTRWDVLRTKDVIDDEEDFF